jgi:replicative DNA helicase
MQTSGKNRMRHEELGEISRGLKILARETGVSVLALSQLTRNSEHEKRAPQLRDLRESGSLEQDADSVLLVHHQRPESSVSTWPAKIAIAKQRAGPLGDATLLWNGRLARFEDAGEAQEQAA